METKAPTVYFDNYQLRDIQLSDASDLFEYGSNMEVVKNLSWGPYHYLHEAKDAIKQYFLTRPKRGLPVGYAIVDLTNNKMIGTVDFHTIHPDNSVEVGYALNIDYWNKGIVTKAVRKLLEVGFYYLGYEKIICGHTRDNIASKRVIEKNNFKFSHSDPRGYYNRFTGDYEEAFWYLITKEEFK